MTSERKATRGTCFVISPIDRPNSDIRKRSEEVCKFIITPPVIEAGYDEPIRADQIAEPGMIDQQVLRQVIEAPLVIADLTEHNANVFYELSLRHALRKPTIHIIHEDCSIPFDVSVVRTIAYSLSLTGAEEAKKDIAAQIDALHQTDPANIKTPISTTIDIMAMARSHEPTERRLAEIFATLQAMQATLDRLSAGSVPMRVTAREVLARISEEEKPPLEELELLARAPNRPRAPRPPHLESSLIRRG